MTAGPNRFLLLAFDAAGNQVGQVCSLAVTPGPLTVSGCPLPDANAGTPYFGSLNAQGGSAPYFISTSGTLPAGIQVSIDGQVSGTPTTAGSFPFSVTMLGSGGQTFTQSCSLNVIPPSLHLTTGCPLPQAQLGNSYTTSISAAGGTAPYHFGFSGFLPDGLQGSADGVLSGTPQSLGGLSFLLQVSDAQNRSITAPCSINVVLPPVPQVQIGALAASAPPAAGNIAIPVQLAQAYSQPIQGQVSLSIQPNTLTTGAASQPDPRLRFLNGLTTASFTLPAGSTSLTVPLVSTGTVASTITVSLANLSSAGANLSLHPTAQIFRIPASAPVVTSACYTTTSTGISLQLNGYTTTRELVQADLTIGTQSFQTDLTATATAYFSDPLSIAAGGTFALTVPIDLTLVPKAPLSSVSVTVFNSIGPSGSQTVSTCQ